MLYVALLLGSLRRALMPRSALLLENLALRQQLAVYQRRGARPRFRAGDRRFWSLLARMWPDWRSPAAARPARDRDSVASHCVATLLDVEEPPTRAWSPAY